MTWPTEQAREAVTEPTRLRIEGTWLVQEVGRHTCGAGPGGHYGLHEPGCGLIPEVDLSTLPGWDDLVRTERAAALREAAEAVPPGPHPSGCLALSCGECARRYERDGLREWLRDRADAEEAGR